MKTKIILSLFTLFISGSIFAMDDSTTGTNVPYYLYTPKVIESSRVSVKPVVDPIITVGPIMGKGGTSRTACPDGKNYNYPDASYPAPDGKGWMSHGIGNDSTFSTWELCP